MNIKDLVIRRIVWVVVGVLCYAVLGLFSGKAQAHGGHACTSVYTCSKPEAYASAVAIADSHGPSTCIMIGGSNSVYQGANPTVGGSNAPNGFVIYINCSIGGNTANVGETYFYGTNGGCPTGQIWMETSHTCAVAPTPDDCLTRNVDAKKPNTIVFSGTACINGCAYGPTKPGFITQPGNIRSGEMGYTGQTCNVPPPNPPPKPEDDPKEVCTPVGTMTMCVKPDGQHCYSGQIQTSREICWSPGETGEKTDGPNKQVVAPGPNPGTPSPPKPGETQSPSGQSGPITTTNNTTNTTATTNVTSVSTGSGANAGVNNSGQDKGKIPKPGDNNPDSDKTKGSMSGGGTCAAPPVCSGDAVLCGIGEQTWRQRCDHGKGLDDEPAQQGELEAPTGVIKNEDGDTENLDTSGFGWGRSCPTSTEFDVFGTSYNFDANGVLCSWLQIGGALMLLFAALASVRILAGVAT